MSSLMLGLEHRQQQGLSPRLQRAVRLLQMSSLDFAQEVYDAVGTNPFLDSEDDGDYEGGRDSERDRNSANDATNEVLSDHLAEVSDFESANPATAAIDALSAFDDGGFAEEFAGDMPGTLDHDGAVDDKDSQSYASELDGSSDFGAADSWQADPGFDASSRRRNDDGEVSAMDLQAVQFSLADHLVGQIGLLPLSARDAALAEAIVASLDDDGYLRTPLAEILAAIGGSAAPEIDPPATEDDLRIALSQVQALEPVGVGARDLQECLLLQLEVIDCEDARDLARRIIEDHLNLLAARDTNGLARATASSPTAVTAAMECIRRLDPRPGLRFGAAQTQYVIPDVIVRKQRGKWTASLNSAVVPKVRLNRVYAEMFQRSRTAQHGEMAANLNEAKWTISNVEQRFATILSVAEAIIARQSQFLEYGPLAMKPLGLREIADAVGVHESTVSRVTNNKYMATPLGVFEFKFFFSRAMATASGGECSATAIRGVIQDLINAESPLSPLSDAELARLLARQGIVVARRTVTKYRQLMRIESFEGRRKVA